MKHIFETASRAVLAAALILPLSAGQVMAQNQTRDQSRDQTREQAQETIYGSQLMTQQERNEYRQRMRNAKTEEERQQLRLEHHTRMQERARARGVTLPDMPPSVPGRGMGPGGMGAPGGGMGGGGGGGAGAGGGGPGR